MRRITTVMARPTADGSAATQSGGGEALAALSGPGRFELRADPGIRLATLAGSRTTGLRVIDTVAVPQAAHCLTGHGEGHYWTCDADGGRILQFSDR
jgi:hypothetical protein